MTAEIVVMNTSAVALAADSAVTITSTNGTKIYNSVNKLFTLSKHQPVGIMIYGTATLCGVPWELIIKEFRESLGRTECSSIPLYLDAFISYIESRKDLFEKPEEHYVARIALAIFNKLCNKIDNQVKAEAEASGDGKVDESFIKKTCASVITEETSKFRKAKFLTGRNATTEKRVLSKYKGLIDEVRNSIFENLPISATHKGMLTSMVGMFLARKFFLQDLSGIVVAGFGGDDNFPNLKAIEIEGVILGKLKFRPHTSEEISIEKPASIAAFAQKHEVQKFMQGVHPHYAETYFKLLGDFSELIIDESIKVLGSKGKTAKKKLTDYTSKVSDYIKRCMTEYEYEHHIKPIIEAVSFLPKDELAAMAESLVNLTSFRHRMSMNAETVGGPIDVAVISRGDGFIWIKRKHYFDPALNHSFFAKYYA